MKNQGIIRIAILAAALLWVVSDASAHCDTMNGPVVLAGRQALEQKDVRYALVWVQPADEPAIRAAFESALSVRNLGSGAKALADRYFFETLVRIHRAGEGAPYTGLKDGDVQPEPGIASAEQALKAGSATDLITELSSALQQELNMSLRGVQDAGKYTPGDVEAGRRYVARYVGYIHYVERVHNAIRSAGNDTDEHHHTPSNAHEEK